MGNGHNLYEKSKVQQECVIGLVIVSVMEWTGLKRMEYFNIECGSTKQKTTLRRGNCRMLNICKTQIAHSYRLATTESGAVLQEGVCGKANIILGFIQKNYL